MAYEKTGTDFPCPRQHKYKNSAGFITNAQPTSAVTDCPAPVVQRTQTMDDFNFPASPQFIPIGTDRQRD